MTTHAAFFLTESVRHARSLPRHEMMGYLSGFCQATDGDPEFDSVRSIFQQLTNCEAQLELIASGQLRLDLADREGVTKKRGRK